MERARRSALRYRQRRRLALLLSLTILAMSCTRVDSAKDHARATIGDTQVTVQVDGADVTVPPGAAPPGTVLTVRRLESPPDSWSDEVTRVGPAVAVDLEGRQPSEPLTVTLHLDQPLQQRNAVGVVTLDDKGRVTDVLPARWDAQSGTLTTRADHLTDFIPVSFDLAAVVEPFLLTTGITTTRPDCDGEPVDLPDGSTVSLNDQARDAPAWRCLEGSDDRVALRLTSSSPLPWRVRANHGGRARPPADLDIGRIIGLQLYRALAESSTFERGEILRPGGEVVYDFPAGRLPSAAGLQVDVGAHLALTVVFAVEYLLGVFDVKIALLEAGGALECVAELVKASIHDATWTADSFGVYAQAVLECLDDFTEQVAGAAGGLVGAVVAIVGSGIALVWAGFEGALRSAAQRDRYLTKLLVDRQSAGGAEAIWAIVDGSGCADADSDARQLLQQWSVAFDNDPFALDPRFQTLAYEPIAGLASLCGRDYAMQVISALNIVGLTYRALSDAVFNTSTSEFFQTPSGNIACSATGPGVECAIGTGLQPPPSDRDCPVDWRGINLTAVAAEPVCAGDVLDVQVAPADVVATLTYGKAWQGNDVMCRSARSGLTCEHVDGHGFFLSRTRWRVW